MNMIQVDEKEIAIARLCVHRDRFETKANLQDKKLMDLKTQAVSLNHAKKTEEAHFIIKKIKRVRNFKKTLLAKIDFVDAQIENIESSMGDFEFSKAIKESNKVISDLNSQIDIEEIEVAKELQQEGKMRREELDQLRCGQHALVDKGSSGEAREVHTLCRAVRIGVGLGQFVLDPLPQHVGSAVQVLRQESWRRPARSGRRDPWHAKHAANLAKARD